MAKAIQLQLFILQLKLAAIHSVATTDVFFQNCPDFKTRIKTSELKTWVSNYRNQEPERSSKTRWMKKTAIDTIKMVRKIRDNQSKKYYMNTEKLLKDSKQLERHREKATQSYA